jgi:hypothetical protein
MSLRQKLALASNAALLPRLLSFWSPRQSNHEVESELAVPHLLVVAGCLQAPKEYHWSAAEYHVPLILQHHDASYRPWSSVSAVEIRIHHVCIRVLRKLVGYWYNGTMGWAESPFPAVSAK